MPFFVFASMWRMVIAAFLCCMAVPVAAQSAAGSNDAPRAELFAGYSFLPETDPGVSSFADAGHGVAAGVSVNLTRFVGLGMDLDTHWWTSQGHGDATFYRGEQSIRLTYMSVGPRVGVRLQRLHAFGSVTVDGQWSDYSAQEVWVAPSPEPRTCCRGSASAWGLGYGGGADISLTTRLAVRALQFNRSLGGFGEGPGRELRLKTGIVFKFD